jgi:AmiR/NasT family two-component response regulator
MSSTDFARTLRVIVCAKDSASYSDAVTVLGHDIMSTCANFQELVLAIPSLSTVPDLIILDTAEADELAAIQAACTSRAIMVPVIIISQDLSGLMRCQGLDIVFGVCSVLPGLDYETLRAVLLLAIVKFEIETKWHFAIEKAAEELECAKVAHKACSILYDYGRAPTLLDAYKLLQEIASSHNRTLCEQAKCFLQLDEATRPRKSTK